MRFAFEQSILEQSVYCLADRGSTYSKSFGDLSFNHPRSLREVSAEDR